MKPGSLKPGNIKPKDLLMNIKPEDMKQNTSMVLKANNGCSVLI